MRNLFKIIFIIVLLLFNIFVILPHGTVQAWDYSAQVSASWTKSGDKNIVSPTKNVVGAIVKIIRIVGTAISIIMITWVAIKYMSAAPNEKAEFKQSATSFIVGAVILFATSNIIGIIKDFVTNNLVTTPPAT